MNAAPPATPPASIASVVQQEFDPAHQSREFRRELDAFARGATVDRQVTRDLVAGLHKRIDDVERQLVGKLDRLLRHLGAPVDG